MQRIVPNLWFDHKAAEAAAFYTDVFPDARIRETIHYPAEGLPDFQKEFADQAELDTYWSQLSSVPDAEVCGWCADKFGVSWQLVPANLAELMSKPGSYDKLMSMKKIEVAAFG